MGKIIDSGNCTHFYYNGCNVWPCQVLDSSDCLDGYVMVKTHFYSKPIPMLSKNVILRDDERLNIQHTQKNRMESKSKMMTNKNIKSSKLPDRASCCLKSPHYNSNTDQIGVKFNGSNRFDVVEYCVSKGFIKTAVYKNGKRKMERGKIITLTRFGVVEPYWR